MPLSALNAVPNGGCRYSGDYHDGKAVYYYDDSSDGRIYNGSFRFSRKYYVLPQGKVVETAIGCFAGDMKEGEWRFSKKSRDVKSVLTVSMPPACAQVVIPTGRFAVLGLLFRVVVTYCCV